MSCVIIYSNFDEWTQFSPLSEFIEKFIRHVGIYSFYEMNCFFKNSLKIIENLVKITYNKLGYVSLVG